MAAQIRAALKFIPPERLVISSDCGMGPGRRAVSSLRCAPGDPRTPADPQAVLRIADPSADAVCLRSRRSSSASTAL